MSFDMDKLHRDRLASALMSGGVSGDAIYDMVLTFIRNRRLSGRMLEFGAGIGNFVRLVHATGYEGDLVAIDILSRPENLPESIGWVECDLNERTPFGDGTFDLLVSTEVIEHLENPRHVFREYRRLLRPGGELIVTTPNQESIRSLVALVVGGYFSAFGDQSYPAHITALLRKDFERLCREHGFSAPNFTYSNDGGLPKAPHIKWQSFSNGLLKGRLFSDNIMMTALRDK